jgi:hypothetical protein
MLWFWALSIVLLLIEMVVDGLWVILDAYNTCIYVLLSCICVTTDGVLDWTN